MSSRLVWFGLRYSPARRSTTAAAAADAASTAWHGGSPPCHFSNVQLLGILQVQCAQLAPVLLLQCLHAVVQLLGHHNTMMMSIATSRSGQ